MLRFTASGDALMVRPFPESYRSTRDAVAAAVHRGDVRLTNLETTITDLNRYGAACSGGTWVTARENVLCDLAALGFNCFGLANNHALDYSYEGLSMTIEALERLGLAHAGTGADLTGATAPALVRTGNGTAAVISVCSTFHPNERAGLQTKSLPGRPGINPLRFHSVFMVHEAQLQVLKEIAAQTHVNGLKELHRAQGFEEQLPEGMFEFGGNLFQLVPDDVSVGRRSYCNAQDLSRICDAIGKAKEFADAVVVQDHSHEVKSDCDEEADYFLEEFAHSCIDSGACAVVGGGTHQLKGIELYRGCPIFYSLGNFVFQNALVEKLPADFMEKYRLPAEASASEAIRARSATATRDLADSTPCFRSVIPYFVIENGRCTELTLTVLELGQERQDEQRNLPHPADEKVFGEVLDYLRRVSACYETRFDVCDGKILVSLEENDHESE